MNTIHTVWKTLIPHIAWLAVGASCTSRPVEAVSPLTLDRQEYLKSARFEPLRDPNVVQVVPLGLRVDCLRPTRTLLDIAFQGPAGDIEELWHDLAYRFAVRAHDAIQLADRNRDRIGVEGWLDMEDLFTIYIGKDSLDVDEDEHVTVIGTFPFNTKKHIAPGQFHVRLNPEEFKNCQINREWWQLELKHALLELPLD